MPKRIQLRRTKGWRKPANTVVVSRPSKWGNHYRVERRDDWEGVWLVVRGDVVQDHYPTKVAAISDAVSFFREDVLRGDFGLHVETVRIELRGKDLACWCPLDQPCHADILLELANREESDG